MKNISRITAIMLIIITLIILLPITAFASYKVEEVKYNRWYRLVDKTDDMTIYKISVPSDTIVNISWKGYNQDSLATIAIFKDKKCNDAIKYMLDLGAKKEGLEGIALYKGTYYLEMWDEDNNTKAKISKKSIRTINKPNYCISKAISMTKNKRYELAQVKNENYNRWYKIKLTKSQVINIHGDIMDDVNGWFYKMYDSNMNEIRCSFSESKKLIKTIGKQKKGTYYLKILESENFEIADKGNYYRIYWN